MTLGEKIKAIREENNLNQKDLAMELGVSTGTVAEWEADEAVPSITEIAKISSYFSVTTDYLIANTANENKKDEKDTKLIISKNEDPIQKHKKSGKSIILILATILLIAIVVTVCLFVPKLFNKKSDVLSFHEDSNAIEEAAESVVKIYCYNQQNEEIATGSGFLAYNNYTIITNYHVIENAHTCKISTNQDITIDVEGIFCYSKEKDIAVLKLIENTTLTPLKLGISTEIKKGEPVVAIGSPLGLKNTVSEGIISGRVMENDMDVLQFSASISSGSSGGALFDVSGKVIGITYASFTDGQNLNLAIPVEEIGEIYNSENDTIITFSDLFNELYGSAKKLLAKWITENGEKIDYSIMGLYSDDPISTGYYVDCFDDTHHYYMEYHEKEKEIVISSQHYPDGAMFPNIYILTLPISNDIAKYSAHKVDVYETAELLITAIGEFDPSTFNIEKHLIFTEYDPYNEFFGYDDMPGVEYEEICRVEICNLIDAVDWFINEEKIDVTLEELGFSSFK